MKISTRLRHAIRRTRTLHIGPVTLVINTRKRTQGHIDQRNMIKLRNKYPLSYSEWMVMFTFAAKGRPRITAIHTRNCYTNGADPWVAASWLK